MGLPFQNVLKGGEGSKAFYRCGYHLNIRITPWEVYREDSFSNEEVPSSIPVKVVFEILKKGTRGRNAL